MTSCKKEQPASDPFAPSPSAGTLYSGNEVTTNIFGVVKNENGFPISGASVSLNGASVLTDDSGIFIFEDISVDEERAYIKVTKAGYFLGSTAFIPSPNSMSTVRITLIQKTITGTFNSNSGGNISVNGAASLIFEPGDISLDNGGSYSGPVNVYAAYIDPQAPNLSEIMPGDLRAVNANDEAVVLETYGMIAVEMFGSNGEALNVSPGQSVTLKMPVSSSQQTIAPSSIPLWYFDETNGNWLEEGSATLSGSEYIGEVGHFSFWNVDKPYPGRLFSCRITNNNGTPLSSILIEMKSSNGTSFGIEYSDQNGEFSGMIPAGIPVDLFVYNGCGNIEYQQSLGNGTSSIDLGTIELMNNSSSNGVISGTLLDCNAQGIQNGYVYIADGFNFYVATTDNNGNFSKSIVYCTSAPLTVEGINPSTGLSSLEQSVTLGPTMNMGNIMVCSYNSDYVSFEIDGLGYTFSELIQGTQIRAFETTEGPLFPGDTIKIEAQLFPEIFYFIIPNVQLNTYSNCIHPVISGITFPAMKMTVPINLTTGANSITVNLTNWDGFINGYAEGTFEGTFVDDSGITHTITNGAFRASIG